MRRLVGWILVGVGVAVVAVSAAPFVFVIATTDDPTINPARQGVLLAVGGFVGLLTAAVGGSVLYRARHGTWPLGF